MNKTLDLDKTVAELIEEYPELKGILADLGFKGVTNPVALKTLARNMTLPKGAEKLGIPLDDVKTRLRSEGFSIKGERKEHLSDTERKELIESYIRRLNGGEDLESVRADFVEKFDKVSVDEIIAVEQELINGGMPAKEVRSLCDIHSALFHGMTEGEVDKENAIPLMKPVDMVPKSHPISALRRENDAIGEKLKAIDTDAPDLPAKLKELKEIKKHYGKKADLIYPFLSQHGITGPSTVMWGVDDEIYGEISALARESERGVNDDIRERTKKVVGRAEEMVYKEENILYDFAIKNFTDEDWYRIYADLSNRGWAFVEPPGKWDAAEAWLAEQKANAEDISEGVVHFPTGDLTVAQAKVILDILPVQVTFIDDKEVLRYFSDNQKVFSRPTSALGRDAYNCHPGDVIPMVKRLIADFKAGTKDHMEVWMPRPDDPVRTLYLPVWDGDRYLGTLEVVQQFGGVKDELMKIWKE